MVTNIVRRPGYHHLPATVDDGQQKSVTKRKSSMTSVSKLAAISMGLLIACTGSFAARADIPSRYSLQEGTVLSTHTPATGTCPITWWQLWIGPGRSVEGLIGEEGTSKGWQVSGTYDSHGTFHLDDREKAGTVDAQVQSDGSLTMRMANVGDQSQCFNRTVYLPWFRNGNDFDPYLSGGD
jgi:hypothetical protein